MASRYFTRTTAKEKTAACHAPPSALARLSEDPQIVCSERAVSGAKRNSSKFLPPLPPSSASKKRLTRQWSESCVSGVSNVTGSQLQSSDSSALQNVVLTPTSRARAHILCGNCTFIATDLRVYDEELFECCVLDAHVNDTLTRSSSVTDTTLQSSNSRHESSGVVKCEEELDEEEDEVRGCAPSEASCDLMVENYPQWNPAVHLFSSPRLQGHVQPDPPATLPSGCTAADSESTDQVLYEQCGLYEEDVFRNLRLDEISRKPAWGYLETSQRDLIVDHRQIMVNWLVEFAEEFCLESETLFLCVAIMDQFLLRGPTVKKGSLQLVGTACMLVAVKFNETNPPNLIKSCCAAAEGSFTQEQVLSMEALVLKTIGYSCAMPTSQTFLWHHLKETNPTAKLEKLSEYLLMLSISDYGLLKYFPSALSAAAVLLGGMLLGKDSHRHLANMRCEYSFGDLKPIIRVLLDLYQQGPQSPHLSSVYRKFLRDENLNISALETPALSLLKERKFQ